MHECCESSRIDFTLITMYTLSHWRLVEQLEDITNQVQRSCDKYLQHANSKAHVSNGDASQCRPRAQAGLRRIQARFATSNSSCRNSFTLDPISLDYASQCQQSDTHEHQQHTVIRRSGYSMSQTRPNSTHSCSVRSSTLPAKVLWVPLDRSASTS